MASVAPKAKHHLATGTKSGPIIQYIFNSHDNLSQNFPLSNHLLILCRRAWAHSHACVTKIRPNKHQALAMNSPPTVVIGKACNKCMCDTYNPFTIATLLHDLRATML